MWWVKSWATAWPAHVPATSSGAVAEQLASGGGGRQREGVILIYVVAGLRSQNVPTSGAAAGKIETSENDRSRKKKKHRKKQI